MLTSLLARFKEEKRPEEPEVKEAAEVKSADPETFVQSEKAKRFVDKWSRKKNPDNPKKPLFKKRGIGRLLRSLHNDVTYKSDDDVLMEADVLLKMLGGMDKLDVLLSGLKAAPHGIIKALTKLKG